MYLLPAEQIRHHVNNTKFGEYLDIANFDESRLQQTSYYFAMGDWYELHRPDGEWKGERLGEHGKMFLEIPPGGYAVVKSDEVFYLTDKVMGIFGTISTFVKSGLELIHAPFVDPHFQGPLEIGLRNRLDSPQAIRRGMPIGKICFFDISDTYRVEQIPDSLQARRMNQLRPEDTGT